MNDEIVQSVEERYAALEAAGWTPNTDVSYPALGPLWHRSEGAAHSYALIAEPKYINRFGRVHGGIIATLADCALGRSSRHGVPGQVQSTIDLDMHFIGGAMENDLMVATGEVLHATRSVVFCRGLIRVGERIIAEASGIWKIQRPRTEQ